MGAGKTFTGKNLKQKLPNMSLIDVDDFIEQSQNMKISQIFENYGEFYFRELEEKAIENIVQNENQIISLGGGAFESSKNREILNKNGYTIYLKASAKVLFDRIKHETHRPLLKQGFGVERVEQILKMRERNYSKALFILNTEDKTSDEIVSEILKRIEDYGK